MHTVPTDPLTRIKAAHSHLTTAQATLQHQVDLAASADHTWSQIAAALGIQTTAARGRYGRFVRLKLGHGLCGVPRGSRARV